MLNGRLVSNDCSMTSEASFKSILIPEFTKQKKNIRLYFAANRI
jgi:hypothetical protein